MARKIPSLQSSYSSSSATFDSPKPSSITWIPNCFSRAHFSSSLLRIPSLRRFLLEQPNDFKFVSMAVVKMRKNEQEGRREEEIDKDFCFSNPRRNSPHMHTNANSITLFFPQSYRDSRKKDSQCRGIGISPAVALSSGILVIFVFIIFERGEFHSRRVCCVASGICGAGIL